MTIMDIFEGRYYKLPRWFLLQTGLWPYQEGQKRFARIVVIYLLVASWVVPQVIIWLEEWGKNITITFENAGTLIFSLAAVTKHNATYLGSSSMKSLLLRIAKDWSKIIKKREKDLLIQYSNDAYMLVAFYTVYLCFAWISYSAMPLLPYSMDLIYPLNTSRPILMPFFADYVFFDQKDHHFFACVHITIVTFAFFLIFSGIDGIYVLIVTHTCGLFAITCDRFDLKKQSLVSNVINGYSYDREQRRLIKAISIHNEALRCVREIEEAFSRSFLVIQLTSTLQLSLGAVYILYFCDDALRKFRITALYIGIIIHLLYFNMIGQKLSDSSERVFNAAYFCDWYLFPPKQQKMIKLVLCRSQRPCQLTAGGVVVLSMESFGK
ncbi:hypothetical protein QAD02_022529, partial [Eretmocerus hayati]